eukprot:m.141226 g.141226  ORF g.141226 m.141226 type:complete len:62 (+) comp52593_c1_seq1:63-248(+)
MINCRVRDIALPKVFANLIANMFTSPAVAMTLESWNRLSLASEDGGALQKKMTDRPTAVDD